MENNELINEFLDGNLNSELEDEFVLKLSTDEDFRSEFKKYLVMEKSLKADAQSITPSAKATMSIFSSLGFNPNANPSSILYSLYNVFNKYSQGIIGGLIAAVLTTMIFTLYINFFNSKDNTSIANKNLNTFEKMESGNTNSLIPAIETDKQDERQLTGKTNLSNRKKTSIDYNNQFTVQNLKYKNEFAERSIQNVDKSKEYLSPIILKVGKEPANLNLSIQTVEYIKIEKPKVGLSFSLFGNQYFSLLKPDIEYQSRPRFSNSGIGMAYSIADNIELTADFRQEYFYQKFEGFDSQGYKVLYSQYPNFYTISAGIKYNLLKFDNISINAGMTAGGNQYGIIGRGIIGLDWSLSEDYKFILGIESSLFRYTHDNNPFYSYKIGLTYGIGFNL